MKRIKSVLFDPDVLPDLLGFPDGKVVNCAMDIETGQVILNINHPGFKQNDPACHYERITAVYKSET